MDQLDILKTLPFNSRIDRTVQGDAESSYLKENWGSINKRY
jgi:hypothetical protein